MNTNLTANNKYISGTLGSGKTTFIKAEIKKSIELGNINIIMDQYTEYEELCNSSGGKNIYIKNEEKIGINPLELNIDIDTEGKEIIRLNKKIEEVTSFLNIFFKEYGNKYLDINQINAISSAIRDSYAEKGIAYDEDPRYKNIRQAYAEKGILYYNLKGYTEIDVNCLYEEVDGIKKKKHLPILSDVKRHLEIQSKTMDSLKEITGIMNIITGNGLISFFDCETDENIVSDITKNAICFSLSELDSFTKKFAALALLNWISGEVLSNHKFKFTQKNVWIDEIDSVIQLKENMNIIEQFMDSEKSLTSIVIASRDTNQFLNTEEGRRILKYCKTKYVFKQSIKHHKEYFLDLFGLNQLSYELIPYLKRGEYITNTTYPGKVNKVEL